MKKILLLLEKLPILGSWLEKRRLDKIYKEKLKELRKRDPFIYKNR
jgi:hypothetical protein